MGTNINLYRTRLAPTPSGFLHLGNILSFSITAALARFHGARILLRIDDLDRLRIKREYIQDIFDTLDFMEIPYDEGPRNVHEFEQDYSQLHRLDFYQGALSTLKVQHHVFACDCSRAQLAASEPVGVYPGTCIRRDLPLDQPGLSWRLHSDVTDIPLPPEMSSFIVRKKDGHPSYQLASLIDDQYFQVDLIVRGLDLWPSTQAQRCLAELLDIPSFAHTTFYHHPLLTHANGKKLSKSAGDISIQYLRKSGLKRAEIFGRIAHMAGTAEPVHDWQELAATMAPT